MAVFYFKWQNVPIPALQRHFRLNMSHSRIPYLYTQKGTVIDDKELLPLV